MAKRQFTYLPDYGGAFDIDPHSLFTKDDLTELTISVEDLVHDKLPDVSLFITDCYLEEDYKTVVLEITVDDFNYVVKETIDLRKIRRPSDLVEKYAPKLADQIVSQYDEDTAVVGETSINSSTDVESLLNDVASQYDDSIEIKHVYSDDEVLIFTVNGQKVSVYVTEEDMERLIDSAIEETLDDLEANAEL